jgi:hypothetical protein
MTSARSAVTLSEVSPPGAGGLSQGRGAVEKPCITGLRSGEPDKLPDVSDWWWPMVKFEPELTVENGGVIAKGPFDPDNEEIIELCAWVFQRDGSKDAAVTEMTHQDEHGDHHAFKGDGELKTDEETKEWSMKLAKVGKEPMKPGQDAFAVAVAMIEDKKTGDQQVIWWGHPVRLLGA